jgi:hypothetical protein
MCGRYPAPLGKSSLFQLIFGNFAETNRQCVVGARRREVEGRPRLYRPKYSDAFLARPGNGS